jgi:uncharacterized repeat protein (TIGR02543 family)
MNERKGFPSREEFWPIVTSAGYGRILLLLGMLMEILGTTPADVSRSALAQSTPANQFAVTVNIVGSGVVTLDPPNSDSLAKGTYYRGAVVKLIARPAPGYVFSGYSGDFKGWMNIETMTINAAKNLTATFSPLPKPRFADGIWTSGAEISKLPTSGLGWDNLKAGADEPIGPPNLSDHEDSVNVAVLAKALVYARTGDEAYRQQVIAVCMAAMGTEQSGTTLALGRGLLAYVLAADLVRLPPTEDAIFRSWLRNLLAENFAGQSLRSSHETRPNNWGTHCGATRAAIARYLDDATELERTARVFKGWLGDRNTYADFTFVTAAMEWQANPEAPVGVNPLGATKNGRSIDGVLPDDQRRSGPFAWPPPKENYVYGALQGAFMQATILYRAGYDVLNWENQALRRALKWLYNEAKYPAEGDDQWTPHIINHFYGTHFIAPFPARPGKNAGWTDWLYGSPHALTVSRSNGNIDIRSLGTTNGNLAVMKLTALPSSGYRFSGWSGDLNGAKNPDTLVMNANKSVTANFVKAGPFKITVTTVGSGTVALDPSDSVYYGGTVVTLTAIAAPGFKFTGWTGALTGTTNPLQLMITANLSLTATFKAIYNLTVEAVDSGAVTLSPPGHVYEEGTWVTLTASPSPGYQFAEWRGDLLGSTNPATLVMNAHKRVTAVFAAIRVTHEETQAGGSSNSTTVATSGSLTAASGQLYLAAISTKPLVKVDAVSGLGLSWRLVKAQCSGRGSSGVELWMAQATPGGGTPSANEAVTAAFDSAPNNAVIAVSRYSGAATENPIGNVISGNTKGQNGACSDGVDAKSYLFDLPATVDGALVYGAAAMRSRSHVPGPGFAERAEISQGSNSAMAALAVIDKVVPSATTVTVNGAFNGDVDWAVVAVEIKPKGGMVLPVDSSGDKTAETSPAPSAFLLHNYPNPFNAQTNIEYLLPKPGQVRLSIYNLNGQRVRTLVEAIQPAGHNKAQWNGRDDANRELGSGFYLMQLEAGALRLTRRIMLLR